MKSNLIIILAFFLMSATTIAEKLIEVKPAKPKNTVIFCTDATYSPGKIKKKVEAGYQVDKMTGDGYGNVVVVMVKY